MRGNLGGLQRGREEPLTGGRSPCYLTYKLNTMGGTATPSTNDLDATFAALAHPARRAILTRLASGEATVTELAEPFEISLPAVSRHLKVLEGAGLIVRGREAQWRPCRLEMDPLEHVTDWVEDLRRHWEERFDRLDLYLRELQGKEKRHDRDESCRRR